MKLNIQLKLNENKKFESIAGLDVSFKSWENRAAETALRPRPFGMQPVGLRC